MIRSVADRLTLVVAHAHGRIAEAWRRLRSSAVSIVHAFVDFLAFASYAVCVFVGGIMLIYILRRLG